MRKQWYGSATFIRYPMDEMMMRSMGMGPDMMRGIMMTGRFDYAFLSGMIPHHPGAITMARWETQVGTHPVLRRIAKRIIRDQGMEIGEMIQMRMSWFRCYGRRGGQSAARTVFGYLCAVGSTK